MSSVPTSPTGSFFRTAGARLGFGLLALGAFGLAQAQTMPPGARDHLERITRAKPADQRAAEDAGRKAAFFCAN